MFLSKVSAKVVGGKNPKWPMLATTKITFSKVWLKLQFNIGFLAFQRSRTSYFVTVLQFDQVLTFKSKMAAAYSSQLVSFQVMNYSLIFRSSIDAPITIPTGDSKPGRFFPNPGFGFGRPQTRVSGSGFATLKSRRQADDV